MNKITLSNHLKNNYEDYYDGDSEWRRIGAIAKADNIITLCRELPQNSIIEIGAGEGSILKRLSDLEFGKELYTLEISSSGIEAIKNKRIPHLVEWKLFDGYNIPYENNRFDIAILSHVIEHVEYPRLLLYEVSRIAKYIFVEVPLEDNIRLKKDYIFNELGHINFYSPKTFRRLIQTCNLEVLKQTITNQSKAALIYQYGKKGLLKYYIKEYLLRSMPGIATKIFTYHSSIVSVRK